jgi:acyl transferase domain-containing protein/thioesterase domain-containing protein
MRSQADAGRFAAVAVVGLSGRFPGAKNPAEFWACLRAGIEGVTSPPDEQRLAADEPSARGGNCAKAASGRLDDIAGFDAQFFDIDPHAAALLDPQIRLFLECAWEALELAGYTDERGGPIAVFAASGPADYLIRHVLPKCRTASTGHAGRPGPDDQTVATRVSYALNLTGPSMNVQTGGTSSLAAVHLACQSLLNGECEMALAGGAAVLPDQDQGGDEHRRAALASDHHHRPFDAPIAGTALASAVGCVLLKRLEDAERDGDHVLAVIRGSAANHAGGRQDGATLAQLAGQVRLVSEALAIAGVHPDEVSYIEAHGSGTDANDAAEIAALTKAFRAYTERRRFCGIGSVKSNIGDAGEAAGVAGLIKTILALQHRELPASLHVEHPDPQAEFADSPFFVNSRLRQWKVPAGARRIAGVTALGSSGTNVHIILEEAPDPIPAEDALKPHLLVLSARTPSALDTATENLATHLDASPGTELADVAFTLLEGRHAFPHRRAVVVDCTGDAIHALRHLARNRVVTNSCTAPPVTVNWLFPGEEALYTRIGAGLYSWEPRYRDALDEALSGLDAALRNDVRGLVLPSSVAVEANGRLAGSSRAGPALLAVQYALGRVLLAWGITPAAMIGHGTGEYAAACFAGVFDIEQAMAMLVLDGRLRDSLHPEAAPTGASGSGDGARIAEPPAALEQDLDEFDRLCRRLPFRAPRRPFVSRITGNWITDAEATDPGYWAGQRQGSVPLAEGIATLLAGGEAAVVEIGPGSLAPFLLEQVPSPVVSTATFRPADVSDSDEACLLSAVGRLWSAGVSIDAPQLFAGRRRRRVPLPTYPFERQRHWIEPEPVAVAVGQATPASGADAARVAVSPSSGNAAEAAVQDGIERELTAIWCQVLELDRVGVHDDFFDMGGHSLIAVRLFQRIRRRYQIDLPVATLFEAPTIAASAALLRARLDLSKPTAPAARNVDAAPPIARPVTASAFRSLVAVRPGNGIAPLFVVHGAGGGVLNMRDLGRAMRPTQTVYALQASGVDGVSPPGESIEQMARAYLEEIRGVQEHGPYLLAGYSGGGIVAFEMAQRLTAAGEAVGLLAFVDTFHPQMATPRIDAWTRVERLRREGASYVRESLERMRTRASNARGQQRIDKALATGEPIPLELRELHMTRHFEMVAQRYRPAPWPGRGLLFRAESVGYFFGAGGPFYGWENSFLGGIEIVTVPGDHRSLVLGDGAVRIAERLGRAIEDALQRHPIDRAPATTGAESNR